MRWNCPHCGVGLNVSDDQLGEGWCFSKCYQCAGFSLVRRSEQNAVRVDSSAEQTQEPSWRLSQRATQSLQQSRATPPPFDRSKPLPAPLPQVQTRERQKMLLRFFTRSVAALWIGAMGFGLYTWLTPPVVPPLKVAQVMRSPAIEAPKLSLEGERVSDSISSEAMAPERRLERKAELKSEEPTPSRVSGFEIEALTPRVQLRAGPGLDFPVVGTAGPKHTYPVVDWRERWFRISIEQNSDGTPKTFAWVRNDLVKLVRTRL